MNDRKAGSEADREILVFLLGSEEYGVDILKVQEIRRYEKVTPLPASPAYVKGVMNLRGVIVPIIDMRLKFGRADATYDALTVVVMLKVANCVVGLVVDGVSDVMELHEGEVQPAPNVGSLVASTFLAGLASQEGRMVMLLDIERLLSSSENMNLLKSAA